MGYFDIANRLDREIRHCRTRAFGARLFANCPQTPSNSEIWGDIARDWEDLAYLKTQLAKTECYLTQASAHVANLLADYPPKAT